MWLLSRGFYDANMQTREDYAQWAEVAVGGAQEEV